MCIRDREEGFCYRACLHGRGAYAFACMHTYTQYKRHTPQPYCGSRAMVVPKWRLSADGARPQWERAAALDHSRSTNCPPSDWDSEADYAPCRRALPQTTGSRPLQRTATEHSRATNDVRDPDIQLQKHTTPTGVRIKTRHTRPPDIGLGILHTDTYTRMRACTHVCTQDLYAGKHV